MPKFTFENTIDELKSTHNDHETSEQFQDRIYNKLAETRSLPTIAVANNNLFLNYRLDRRNLEARQRVRADLAQKLSQRDSADCNTNVPSVLQGLQKAYHYYTNYINESNDQYEIRRAFNNDRLFRELDNTELLGKSAKEQEKLKHEKALQRGRQLAGICGDYANTSAFDMLNWNDAEIVRHFDEVNHIYQLTSILQQTLDNQNPDIQFDEKTRKRCQHMYEMCNAASYAYQRLEQIMSPHYPYLNISELVKDNSIQDINKFCANLANNKLPDKDQQRDLTDLSTVLQNTAEAKRRRAVALVQAQGAHELGIHTLESATFSHPDGREFDITDPTDELIEYITSGKPIIVGGVSTQKQLCYNPDSGRVQVNTTAYGHVREQLFAADGGLDALVQQMQDADPGYLHNRLYNNGSPQFNDMKKALLRFSETVKQLKTNTAPISNEQLEELKALTNDLSKKATAYLNYKGAPTSDLATRRVNAATALRNFLTGVNGTPGLNGYLNQMVSEKRTQLSNSLQESALRQHPAAGRPHVKDWIETFQLTGKVDKNKLSAKERDDFSKSIKKFNDIDPFFGENQHSNCIDALNARMNNLYTRSPDLYVLFNPAKPNNPNKLPKRLFGTSLHLAQETMRSTILKHLLVKEASSLDNKSNLLYRSIKDANINDALQLVSDQDVFQQALDDITPADMYEFITTMDDPNGPMQKLAKDVGKAIYKEAYLAKSTQKKQLSEGKPTLKATLARNGLEHRKIERVPGAK